VYDLAGLGVVSFAATTRIAMSRSVTMPVRRPFCVTGTTPASSCFMIRAASTMFSSESIVEGFDVIT
jgi:hypothetical protein